MEHNVPTEMEPNNSCCFLRSHGHGGKGVMPSVEVHYSASTHFTHYLCRIDRREMEEEETMESIFFRLQFFLSFWRFIY